MIRLLWNPCFNKINNRIDRIACGGRITLPKVPISMVKKEKNSDYLPMSSCFVAQLDLSQAEKLKALLLGLGFDLGTPQHTVFQGKKKGLSVTLYLSGKLTVQGKEMKEFIEFYLEPQILQAFAYGYEHLNVDEGERIGIDESGKGDFFGPLCVAGVYAAHGTVGNLTKIGVKDSKTLSESAILKIAEKIKKDYLYYIVKINPEKYNVLYEKFGNLNLLLGWGHATCIEHLIEKTRCERVIIDQFAAERVVEEALRRKKRKANLTQRHRGEEDPVVAAASILARAAFVEGLNYLGREIEETLPKGASALTLKMGEKVARKHGLPFLNRIGKLHFKTYREIAERVGS